jgi:hypothetical protein
MALRRIAEFSAIIPAMETLYKNKIYPANTNRAEYCEIGVRSGEPEEEFCFYLEEYRGWWDEKDNRAVHNCRTLSQSFDNSDAAHLKRRLQVEHRVHEGFIHSYSCNHYSADPKAYNYVQLKS